MDLVTLFSNFGNLAFTLVTFVVALSIIVTVHEYGHYIVGRWSGIKADVFSIGFGKPLWQRRDKRGTVWQIAALPFGGYVKFAGDANAASAPDPHAVDGLSAEQKRHTMPGAPLWARTLTVAAGPVFNFVFSFLIFAAFILFNGRVAEPLTVESVTLFPEAVALQAGDEILAVGGQDVGSVEAFFEATEELPEGTNASYTLRRDGETFTVDTIAPRPPIVSSLSPKSAAYDAGLKDGDVILSVNDQTIEDFRELQDIVSGSDGVTLDFTIWRAGETFDVELTPRRRDLPLPDGGFETRWLIGITGGMLFTFATEGVGLGEAIQYAALQVWSIIEMSLSGIYHMAVGAISTCNLSGPVGIAETASTMASQGTTSFIGFIALLSTAIGLMNLFPIPVLDGGHLVFYAYEAVARRPLPDRAVSVMMSIGMALILGLMLMGLFSDLFCV